MKKLKSILMLSITAIFLLSGVALAHWDPGDGHKMHEPQLPDVEVGYDVNATFPVVLADDWMCSETGEVKDLHFWGSWLGDDIGIIDYFLISFHENIPVGPDGWSIPGAPIMPPFPVYQWDERLYFQVPQGWYDPTIPFVYPIGNHFNCYQYNIYLDEAYWFLQEEGGIYWVNISAVLDPTGGPPGAQWGWKSAWPY